MRIAVAGASGTAGRRIVAEIARRGHDAVPLSRRDGVDLATGDGLGTALAGVDVVVDASDVRPDGADPRDSIPAAARRLDAAATAAGVRRTVLLSINGIDHPGLAEAAFYAARRAHEAVVLASALDHRIVRTAQWFEFHDNPFAVIRDGDVVRVQDWLVQPVALDAVVTALVDAAIDDGAPARTVLVGPEHLRLPDLTRAVLRDDGDDSAVEAVPAYLPAYGTGALLPEPGARTVGPGLAGWLRTRRTDAGGADAAAPG